MAGGSQGSLLFHCRFFLLTILVSSARPLSPLQLMQVEADTTSSGEKATARSPFSIALENLQKQIGYEFKDVGILRRAMTHPSFSEENHRALGVAGVYLIQSAVAVRYLSNDPEISGSDLSSKVVKMSDGSACARDALALGLEKVVRVAPKTNATSAVCGAYRALYGAIALDSGTVDSAVSVFWNNHGGFVSAI
ncbi:protein NUCLEAR FUSION DEFECTIVE 2 isoform X1 [Nymphaea colorata]|nr:protein NUCLEAR FUSION DEFECTIVE 2 isoform X1 [Nymphaea colorata]